MDGLSDKKATSAGAVSFRFDYRLNGRRETLVIGRYDPGLPARGARAADKLSLACRCVLRKHSARRELRFILEVAVNTAYVDEEKPTDSF